MSRSEFPFDLLLFDLDGVVTTEHIYWECARLTIWELFQAQLQLSGPYQPAVHAAHARELVIPQDLIYVLKNRAINSNWDLTYLVACGLLQALPAGAGQKAETLEALLPALQRYRLVIKDWRAPVEMWLDKTAGLTGAELLHAAGHQTAQRLDLTASLVMPEGPLWRLLHARFQGWYNGRLMGAWGAMRLPERPVMGVEELQQVFATLQADGYLLGIVTGRPLDEAVYALEMFGILHYFAPDHTATFDDVAAAQQALGQSGLGKPHPFAVRKAMCPGQSAEKLMRGDCSSRANALMIGDSTSDAFAAERAGIPCLGVTSGVYGAAAKMQRQQALLDAGCCAVLSDIRALSRWLAL